MATGILQTLLQRNPAVTAQNAVAQGRAGAYQATGGQNGQNMSYNTSNGQAPSAANPLIGIKAKSPANNVKAPNTTLAPSQVDNTPKQNSQSTTDGGTGQTVPTYGSTFYDPKTGAPAGTNQFDPNTGAPLKNPNVSVDTSTQQQNANKSNNGLYGTLIGNLQQSTDKNQAITDKSQGILTDLGNNIATLRGNAANTESAYQTGMIAPRAQGLAQNVAQTEAAQEGALQAGVTTQLAGTAQALTGQAQTQSGLNQAATLAAPSNQNYQVSPGNTVYNSNNQQVAGGLGGANGSSQAISNLASQVASGAMGYQQAIDSIGAYANDPNTVLSLQNAIRAINPSFNISTSNGAAAGAQAGASTVASTPGNITAQQQTTIAGYQSALQQGHNLQSQLTDLITTFGLNPNDVNAVNSGLQTIAKNTSSPQYKILENYVNDIANTYAQILTPPGGSATDTTRGIATSMLDATASGTSLIATMQSLDQAANAKIAGVSTTGNTSGGTTASGANPWH